jgi:hypothetical protein
VATPSSSKGLDATLEVLPARHGDDRKLLAEQLHEDIRAALSA